MPYAPPRACARCGATVPKGQRCPCRPAWEGSTHPGDDARMQQLRKDKLERDPICEWNRNGERCRRPADEVDHIVPLAEDPSLRYVWSNLQSLCRPHHKQKTTEDALRGKRRAR